jgi:acetylglutamate kinase
LAVGLSGEDANLISAVARSEALGFVGDVVGVDPTIVLQLLAQGLIPVVATIGTDGSGQAFNINADTAAGALAAALKSEKLVFLTDVAGLRADPADPASLLHRVDAEQLDAMVSSGAANGGMIPKVEACAWAVRHGVRRAHILDGRTPHALLLELFTDEGVGTMVGVDL